MLKSEHGGWGSQRGGVETWRNARGELMGETTNDPIGDCMRVLKSDNRASLEFSALFGTVGPRMHVNRMLSDYSTRDYEGEQRAEVEKSLRRRERMSFGSVEKLLS